MGEPCEPSPQDRAEIRRLASAVVESVRADEAMPHGLTFRDGYDKDDAEGLVLQMAMEIEALASERGCRGEPHTCDQELVAAAEGRTDRLIEQLAAVTAARDEACRIAMAFLGEPLSIQRGDRLDDRISELRKAGQP